MLDSKVAQRLLKQAIREIVNNIGMSAGKDTGTNLRGGVPVRANTNVLDDEADQEQLNNQNTMKAACCLVLSDDGQVLAVSRKDDPTAFGLPGGKVDPGEDSITAAARELQEETGLTATRLHPVFTRSEHDGYTTTTFATEVTGQINTPESGVVRWVDPEVLFAGPFGEYNRRLWRKLGLPTKGNQPKKQSGTSK